MDLDVELVLPIDFPGSKVMLELQPSRGVGMAHGVAAGAARRLEAAVAQHEP